MLLKKHLVLNNYNLVSYYKQAGIRRLVCLLHLSIFVDMSIKKSERFNSTLAILLLQLCALCSFAQQELPKVSDPNDDWEKKMLRANDFPKRLESITCLKVAVHWESMGPNVLPEELNPGGSAIPAYSVNRGNGTGRINYLYIHPKEKNKVWACSPTGGLWFSRNNGYRWQLGGTDQLPISGVSSVAVNLKKPKQWVLSTGDGDDQFMRTDGIWRTTNSGRTYEKLNGGDPSTALPIGNELEEEGPTFIGEVVCSPYNFNYLMVASSNGFWICENASKRIEKKWKRIAEGKFYDIEYIPSAIREQDIIACSGEKLVVSYDAGSTWEMMPNPEYPNPDKYPFLRMSIEFSAALPNFLYVAVTCSERATSSQKGEGTLQLFDLKARRWEYVKSFREGVDNVIPTRARAFTVSPIDPNVVLCANVMPIHRSSNGGHTFSKIEKNQMHDDIHHIQFSHDGKTVWASHDGGVSISRDGGLHWKNRDHGIGAANIFGLSVAQSKNKKVAFGGYDTGGNLLSNQKWFHTNWGDGFETIIHPEDENIIFTTMQNGMIFRSKDGNQFEQVQVPNSKTEWHTWIRMHPTFHNTIFCAGKKLARSSNLGDKWEYILDVSKVDSTMYNAYRFYLSKEHPNEMYAYLIDTKKMINPAIYKTTNLLETDATAVKWQKVADVPVEGWIMNICIDPNNSDKFWLLYNRLETDKKIFYFDGEKYIDHSDGMGNSKCESMVLDATQKRIYVGGSSGIFTKKTSDKEWILLTGLPGTYIKSLDINYVTKKLVVGTFGRGVWEGSLILE